jgi:hypothetical protein
MSLGQTGRRFSAGSGCGGRVRLRRRIGSRQRHLRWQGGHFEMVDYLVDALLCSGIALGGVALDRVVNRARQGHDSFGGLYRELFSLQSGIGTQFVLNVAHNLRVIPRLAAASRRGKHQQSRAGA